MRMMCWISFLSTVIAALPATAAEEGLAMIAATKEIDRQVSFLQELYSEDSKFAGIIGVFDQTTDLQAALINFRRKVNANASREAILLGFDMVEQKVSAILSSVALLEKSDPGLRLVCRHLRSAESDLHYAVFADNVTPALQLAVLNRQISTQQTFVSSLSNNVNLAFAGKEVLTGWKDDLSALQKSLLTLQELTDKKATLKELKEQVVHTDKLWDKIVQRYNDSKQNQPGLQAFILLVDQKFAKLSQVVGVKDRRASLTDGLSK